MRTCKINVNKFLNAATWLKCWLPVLYLDFAVTCQETIQCWLPVLYLDFAVTCQETKVLITRFIPGLCCNLPGDYTVLITRFIQGLDYAITCQEAIQCWLPVLYLDYAITCQETIQCWLPVLYLDYAAKHVTWLLCADCLCCQGRHDVCVVVSV